MEDQPRNDLALPVDQHALSLYSAINECSATHHFDKARDDNQPDDDPRDSIRRLLLDVLVDHLQLSTNQQTQRIPRVATHKIASDCQSIIEDLSTRSNLEIIPNGFVQWVKRCFRPEQLGGICSRSVRLIQ